MIFFTEYRQNLTDKLEQNLSLSVALLTENLLSNKMISCVQREIVLKSRMIWKYISLRMFWDFLYLDFCLQCEQKQQSQAFFYTENR